MVGPKAIDLAEAQAGAIDHCQQRPMLEIEGGLQDLFDRLAGQHERPMMGAPTRGNMEVGPTPAQDLFVETAVRAEVDVDRAPGQAANGDDMDEKRLDLFVRELIGRTPIIPGQLDHRMEVGLVGARRKPAQNHVLAEPGPKGTHG